MQLDSFCFISSRYIRTVFTTLFFDTWNRNINLSRENGAHKKRIVVRIKIRKRNRSMYVFLTKRIFLPDHNFRSQINTRRIRLQRLVTRLLISPHKGLLMIDEALMVFAPIEAMSYKTASKRYISPLSAVKRYARNTHASLSLWNTMLMLIRILKSRLRLNKEIIPFALSR